jgi:hypothetical protein
MQASGFAGRHQRPALHSWTLKNPMNMLIR